MQTIGGIMSRSGEYAMQQEEQQNLSGAFDHEEYLESQFEKDFAEFVAVREKDAPQLIKEFNNDQRRDLQQIKTPF